MKPMENFEIFTLKGTEIYSFCKEELPLKDIQSFIIDCPVCGLSRDILLTDVYTESIEFVAPSNGYFFIGLPKGKYEVENIIKSLYDIDFNKVQKLDKKSSIFEGYILLYEGRPFSYISEQFSTLKGEISLMSVPYKLINRDPYWNTIFKTITLDKIKEIFY